MPSTVTVIRGRNPSVTGGVLAASALAAAALFVLAIVAARLVVFRGFELAILFTLAGLAAGVVAARAGGSLLAAVAAVFAPNATLVALTGPGVGDAASAAVALGTVLYVAGGVAAPGGMLAYAAGVRWRTGPWEPLLRDHVFGGGWGVRPLVGWTAFACGVAAASAVAPGVVSLGVVQFCLLVGGLVVAAWCGSRTLGLATAVGVGTVGAAFVALAWTVGTGPTDEGLAALIGRIGAFLFGFGLFVGAPVGLVGYAAGRALRADATAGVGVAPADPVD